MVKRGTRVTIPSCGTCKKVKQRLKIKLKSLIMAQIERWRQA